MNSEFLKPCYLEKIRKNWSPKFGITGVDQKRWKSCFLLFFRKCFSTYFEFCLFLSRIQNRARPSAPIPMTKASKFSPAIIQEQIEGLMEMMPLRSRWAPVDKFVELSGIITSLQVREQKRNPPKSQVYFFCKRNNICFLFFQGFSPSSGLDIRGSCWDGSLHPGCALHLLPPPQSPAHLLLTDHISRRPEEHRDQRHTQRGRRRYCAGKKDWPSPRYLFFFFIFFILGVTSYSTIIYHITMWHTHNRTATLWL